MYEQFRWCASVGWVLSLCACAGARAPQGQTPAAYATPRIEVRNARPPIDVDLPDEAVVHVVSKGAGCSGTLVSARLVLTAHHCVVVRDARGNIVDRDLRPDDVLVELGGDDLPWGVARVRAIVSPACGYRGGAGDLALLVLDRELTGIPVMAARLDGPPIAGELVEPIGFGRCGATAGAIHRVWRSGGPIEQLDGAALSATASICPGDSGGPARSRSTGEVVGVISAAVMDDDDRTADASAFTRVDVWRSLFAEAEQIARTSTVPGGAAPSLACNAAAGVDRPE